MFVGLFVFMCCLVVLCVRAFVSLVVVVAFVLGFGCLLVLFDRVVRLCVGVV